MLAMFTNGSISTQSWCSSSRASARPSPSLKTAKETNSNFEINKCPLSFSPLNMFKQQCLGNSTQWDYSGMKHTCIYVYLYIYTYTFFPCYKHHKKKCLGNMCTWMHNCIYQFIWLHINAYVKKTPVCRACNVFIIPEALTSSLKSSWL